MTRQAANTARLEKMDQQAEGLITVAEMNQGIRFINKQEAKRQSRWYETAFAV